MDEFLLLGFRDVSAGVLMIMYRVGLHSSKPARVGDTRALTLDSFLPVPLSLHPLWLHLLSHLFSHAIVTATK